MARHRRRWQVWQGLMESTSLVFLDESGVSTNMTRRYGWAPKGDRLVDAVPHGHWKITTIVAGLTASGVVAPFVIDGPMEVTRSGFTSRRCWRLNSSRGKRF